MVDEKEIKSAPGEIVGKSLTGLGINLLVRDIKRSCSFLEDIFNMKIIRADNDFAIARYANQIFLLHSDASYSENPLPCLLPENGARGAGVEIRLYTTDPDEAEKKAKQQEKVHNCTLFKTCSDRPHGLRECYILDENGYCFVPSKHSSH